MSEQTKNEIFKSFIYGMTIEEIAEIYGISEDDLRELLEQNAGEIADLKAYRAELEG